MKYLSEYRNLEATKKILDEIHKITTQVWNIMEICGGQTHSLVKNGILELLPEKVRMIHGPGCPVCVTPLNLIDKAIELLEQGVILCSFGDMIRVPGSKKIRPYRTKSDNFRRPEKLEGNGHRTFC